MEFNYTVPLTSSLYMHGVLYSLWKSRTFLLAIALLAAIYSALFSPMVGVTTVVIVAGLTWAVTAWKYRRLCKMLGGQPVQQYSFRKHELTIETKGLGKIELLREHASLYKVYRDAVYFNYVRTSGICVFIPSDPKKREETLSKLEKLKWLGPRPGVSH